MFSITFSTECNVTVSLAGRSLHVVGDIVQKIMVSTKEIFIRSRPRYSRSCSIFITITSVDRACPATGHLSLYLDLKSIFRQKVYSLHLFPALFYSRRVHGNIKKKGFGAEPS